MQLSFANTSAEHAYATAPFLSALYADVKQRLPLWRSDFVPLDGGTAKAVRSTCCAPDGTCSTKVFFGVEAAARRTITPAVLSAWVRDVTACSGAKVGEEDVCCYLCFIDTAGAVSYYACETASAME